MKPLNLNPKYAARLNKYVRSKKITIDTDDLDHTLGDLLLLSRIKKHAGCKTMRELKSRLK